MLGTSLQPACISAEESQMLAGMNTKEVFGWVMGKLAKDDELLTVAVADYGRRLNLDRFRELRPEATSSAELQSRTLLKWRLPAQMKVFTSLRRATPRL